ncbi:hypothetical protein QYE76_034628 [Lolium multiflorum]|uniref:Uncharacterized protein n=1 Tax=Lolium multiflorum TaxID=4521 RepID=A0AAD8VN89_LOLMU|nr:hypothetical protein QYE76_034628 [Lolium multiflorum]
MAGCAMAGPASTCYIRLGFVPPDRLEAGEACRRRFRKGYPGSKVYADLISSVKRGALWSNSAPRQRFPARLRHGVGDRRRQRAPSAHRSARPVSADHSRRADATPTTGDAIASSGCGKAGAGGPGQLVGDSLLDASDNAGCFADRPFPAGGSVISFGEHDVYVVTVAPPRYPQQVLRCASPPPGASGSNNFTGPCVMQVMATGDENTTRTTRTRGPHLERNADGGGSASGPKVPPPPSPLDAARARLSTPLTAGADPTTIEADLEAHRQHLLTHADELAAAKRQLEITRCEFNRVHDFTPGGNGPSRAGQIRRRGGGLGAEIDRDGADSPAPSMELSVYNTPEKKMCAAEAAAEELSHLEGEELRRQTRRVTELLHMASEQQKNPRYAGNVVAAAGRTEAAPGTRRSRPLPPEPAGGSQDPMPAQA